MLKCAQEVFRCSHMVFSDDHGRFWMFSRCPHLRISAWNCIIRNRMPSSCVSSRIYSFRKFYPNWFSLCNPELGKKKVYFQYTLDLFQITNWRLSRFASKLPWTPWRWCQNQLWRPESKCCRCSWTRPLVLLIHHRRSEKDVIKTLFGVFLTAEGG